MEPVFDKLGQEIKVGSFVAYGHALGRCAGLRIGKVLKLAMRKDPSWSDKEGLAIVVWGIDDEWPSMYEPVLCKSKGYLQFPDRIVVMPEETVSEAYRKLLEPVTFESTFKSLGSPEQKRKGK